MEDMGVKGYGTMSKGQSNRYSILAFYFFPFTFTLLTNPWQRKYLNTPNKPNSQKRITENGANEPNFHLSSRPKGLHTFSLLLLPFDLIKIRDNRRNPWFKIMQNKPNFQFCRIALTPLFLN